MVTHGAAAAPLGVSRAGGGDLEHSTAARAVATAGLLLAVVMQTIDTTIANVALPHMQGSLSAGRDQITWVLTSYIVATAITTPLTGWLALKFGRKPVFLISIATFVGASVLCGVATSLPEIVFFRFFQGMAASGMMPLSQAALLDIWSAEMMPKIMSLWSSMIMVGPIIGPTLGGYITEHFSWRWVFYINLPVGVLAFLLVLGGLPPNPGGRERRFDSLGYFALVAATGGVQLMADRGQMVDWFQSGEVWTYVVLALCGLHVFILQMLTARQPFFHRDVLTDRNFVTCITLQFFISVLLYTTNAMLPTFMQTLLGYTAEQSGFVSMYRAVGAGCSFLIAPWAARTFKPRPTVLAGLTCSFAGLWQMAHFDLSMTAWSIRTAICLQGFGLGLMTNPLVVLAYSTLDPRHRTEGSVFSTVLRTMGGSLGIAGVQAMLTRQGAEAHERLAEVIAPTDPVVRWALRPLIDGATGVQGLEAVNAEVTRQATMLAYDSIFAWLALCSVCIAPMLLLLSPARTAYPPARGGALSKG
jgi:DHA2 family multidrug resistance protein